jgi:hypothetical protein
LQALSPLAPAWNRGFPFEIPCSLHSLNGLHANLSSCAEAHRFVRKMSGGSQAHLIQAVDGRPYVVKFTNNPQHPRILINEWMTSRVLRHLGILTPDTAIVNFSADFIRDNPELYVQLRSRRTPPPCGSHFGSLFAGEPGQTAHSRSLRPISAGVANLSDFCGVLVADKWLGNTDSRQSVFVRVSGVHSPLSFLAHMIDNGQVFDGGNWRFEDSPLRGPYFGPVYPDVQSLEAFDPWLKAVATFPEALLRDAFQLTPSSWRCGDTESAFGTLLGQLMRRRGRVGDLICACRAQPTNPFPNWL